MVWFEGVALLLEDGVIAVVEELLTPLFRFVGGLEGADSNMDQTVKRFAVGKYRIAALAQRAYQDI